MSMVLYAPNGTVETRSPGIGPNLAAPTGNDSAAGGQPRREVVGALEVEQGFRQGLELLQR